MKTKKLVLASQTNAFDCLAPHAYLEVINDSLNDLLRGLGFKEEIAASQEEGWAETKHEIKYLQDLKSGDQYSIWSTVENVDFTRLTTRHKVFNGKNKVCAEALIELQYYSFHHKTPKDIPPSIRGIAALGIAGFPPY